MTGAIGIEEGPPPPRFARRSVAFLGSLNFVGQFADRLLTFGQVALLAAIFGTGTRADLFFLASIIPLTVGSSLGEPIARAFLTQLVRERTRAEATAVAAAGFLATLGVLLAVTALYLAAAAAIVPVDSPAGSHSLAPWVAAAAIGPAMGLAAYVSAVLLWLEHYTWAAARLPIGSAAGVVFLGVAATQTKDVAWFLLAWSLGYLVTVVALYARIARDLGAWWMFAHSRAARQRALALRRKLVAPTLGSILGGQVIVLVERALAASLGPGAVSLISYARGIAGAPTIVGTALGAGAYPALVRAEAAHAYDYLRSSVKSGLRLTILAGSGLALYLALFGTSLVSFFFQRGAFGNSSSDQVGRIVAAFAVSTAAGVVIGYLVQVIYGVDRFSAVLYVQVVVLFAYLIAVFAGRSWFGLTGLAIGFSVSQVVGVATACFLAARRIGLRLAELLRGVLLPAAAQSGLVAAAMLAYRAAIDLIGVSGRLQRVR